MKWPTAAEQILIEQVNRLEGHLDARRLAAAAALEQLLDVLTAVAALPARVKPNPGELAGQGEPAHGRGARLEQPCGLGGREQVRHSALESA